MLKSLFLAALVCVAVAQNSTNPPPPQPTPDAGSLGPGSLGNPMAQQALSTYTASIMLEWQSANSWASFVGYLHRLNTIDEQTKDDDDYHYGGVLEEEDATTTPELQVDDNLLKQEAARYPDLDPTVRVEFLSEESLSAALKIMHIQTAAKLNLAEMKHYQNQMAVAMIQASGLGQGASYLLMLMYYRSVLDTLGSMASIVRHDAWTLWNHQEMTETIVFKDADGMPGSYSVNMDKARVNAMNTWNMETSIDIQSLFIDLYLQAAAAQLTGSVQGSSVPGTSFLEEEATAEPAQPSQQSVGGSVSPQMASYWAYMMQMMTLYSRWMEHSASQSFATVAQIEANPDMPWLKQVQDTDKYTEYLKKSGLVSWTQWARIKQFLAYYNLFFLWAGAGGFGSMAGGSGGSLGAALGGSFGGPSGSLLGGSMGATLGNAAVMGSALGGSMYGPYGSMLGGSLGSSL